jgi:AcrR family transcriptional regulator
MPGPRGPRNPEETRRRLVAAAARRFADQGYGRTSLNEIAREAGMTAPSLLYHFASKEALFNAVLRATWSTVRDRLAPILADDALDAETMLVRVLQSFTSFEHDQELLFTELHAALLSGDGTGAEAVADTLLPLVDEIEDAIRRAAGSPPANEAPIRQVLLYIVLAHTAQHQLGRLAPSEMELLSAREPALVVALLGAALSPAAQRAT